MKSFNKLTCLVLSASLLVCALCPQLVAHSAQNGLKIAVGSDLHFQLQNDTLPINCPDSELYFHAQNAGVLYNETGAILDEFLKGCVQNSVDCVIIPGDITNSGTLEQHTAIAQILGDFEDDTGIPVYVSTGNHDLYHITVAEYKQIYHRFGFDEAVAVDDITASYAVDLVGEYRLISIDSCSGEKDGDAMDSRLYDWIEQQAASAYESGNKPIAMLHHPIMEHIPLHSLIMKDFILQDWESAAAIFADSGIKYVFTGHEHGNDIARFLSSNGNEVYDIITSALAASPLTYRLVTFTPDNVTFDTARITSIDMTTLTAGYTQAQMDLMTSDYPAYALGFFKRSIEYKIAKTISAEKLKSKLGGDDSPLAPTIDRLMPLVDEALSMPMYRSQGGANSIQELANENGATLPPSDYKSLYDLVGTIVNMHYRGDENIPMSESPEGELFIKALNTALKYVLTNFSDSTVTELVKSIAGVIGLDYSGTVSLEKWCVSIVNGGEDSYELAETFLEPLLAGFLVDDAPADNNAVLPSYDSQAEKPDYPTEILGFIKDLLTYFTALINAFIKAVF